MFLKSLLNYVNSYNESIEENIDANIELEIKILLDPRIKTPIFANTAPDINSAIKTIKTVVNNARTFGNPSISQTINFIQTRKTDMFVKQLCFTNGVQDKSKKIYYTKKPLVQPIYLISDELSNPSYKLSVNVETSQNVDIEQFDIVRFRLRYSIDFNIDDLKDWKLELTLVKEIHNPTLEQLKKTRDSLFVANITCDNFIETVDWANADRIELELEYKSHTILDKESSLNISIDHILQLDKLWKILHTNQRTYLDCICQIAQIIKPNNLDKFKQGYFGLKQLGSNPFELTKDSYTNIRNDIDNFILTEKIDGIRSMLIIYPKKGDCHIINKQYKFMKIPINFTKTEIKDELIILDAEEYEYDGKSVYYVFDCIWYNKNISTLNFSSHDEDRMEYVEKSVKLYDFLKSKHFIHLTKNDYSEQIKEFYEFVNLLPYKTDGFIIISKNDDYNNTMNSKWKPIEKMTIDFVAKKCPSSLLGISPYINKDNNTLYLLFSGIRHNEYKKLGVKKIKNYESLFKKVNYKDKYFPIQFSPSSDPYAYLFWTENSDLDGKIVELAYSENLWKLFKIRTDRNVDMSRKTYYGNYFKIAEYVWMNYKNPLTLKNLCDKCDDNKEYFKNNDNKEYTYLRKFNNFVKSQLIKLYTQNKSKTDNVNWVIDLASGKGQDLFKYIDCDIKNILMIDIDNMAMLEVINRKYTYINNKNIKQLSKIFIKQLDLSDSYKTNLVKIQESRFGIPSDGVPLVVCNLALHYLTPNKKNIQNFTALLNKLLEPGGIFIYTAFNGQKIFDLLKDIDKWERRINGKLIYSIKKKYTESEFTGINQKIDVLLPFSNGQYYTEYLINTTVLEEELMKKKITLVNEDKFDIYLKKFKKDKPNFYKSLTKIDNEFISLYSFYIFHKPNKSRRK
jgi:hypothetical protein